MIDISKHQLKFESIDDVEKFGVLALWMNQRVVVESLGFKFDSHEARNVVFVIEHRVYLINRKVNTIGLYRTSIERIIEFR